MQIVHKRKGSNAKSTQRALKNIKDNELFVYGENKISEFDYHKLPYLSAHKIKDFANPELSDYYLWRKHIKRDVDFKETPALAMGRAIHTILLEPKYFKQRFTVKPESINRRTKVGREEYEQFLKDNAHKTILTEDQMAAAQEYAKAKYPNKTARELLKPMAKEVSGFNVIGGHLFKGRADAINWKHKFGADVKTVEDISPYGFARACAKYRYDLQELVYRKIFDLNDFAFICYTKVEPLECVIYQLTDAWREKAENDFAEAMLRYERIIEADEHFSYITKDDPVIALDPPAWFK